MTLDHCTLKITDGVSGAVTQYDWATLKSLGHDDAITVLQHEMTQNASSPGTIEFDEGTSSASAEICETAYVLAKVVEGAAPMCTFRSATLPNEAACDALCAAAGCGCAGPWLLYKQTSRGVADAYYCSSAPMKVYGLVTPTGESYRAVTPV